MLKNKPNQYRYCPNCHTPFAKSGDFCYNCGQKFTDGKMTVREMLHEFSEAIFNVDSKIFRTLGALFIPGKLTNQYFKGRHKRYVHPLRLFFVLAVLHFAVLSIASFSELEKFFINLVDGQKKNAYQADFMNDLDSAQLYVYKSLGKKRMLEQAFDTLHAHLKDTRSDSTGLGYIKLRNDWQLEPVTVRISNRDLVEMPEKEFFETYKIEGLAGQLQIWQTAKIMRQGGSFTQFLLGKLIWMVLLMMPALGLILKLLYIRRRRLFVEHLVFSFHYHAFAFLIMSIGLLIPILRGLEDNWSNVAGWISLSFPIIMIYLFVAMRKVYQQGFFKTFIKYSVLNFSYLFIFVIFLSLTLIVSVLLF